jgi:TRAP transporter TAXI family solute receptor
MSPRLSMRKLSRIMIGLAAIGVLAVAVYGWYTSRQTLPSRIRIVAGKPGGLNDTFAHDFAQLLQESTGVPVSVEESKGTEENVERLRQGKAELAVFQTHSLPPARIVGIAPLFTERLHFIVRKKRGISKVADLVGKRVALGSKGSGMRQNALTVLAQHGLDERDLTDVEEPFGALEADPNLDAAFVTSGWMNPLLKKRLQQNDVELVGIDDTEGLAARHPWFTAATIPPGLYPGKPPAPSASVPTVAVMALLAAREDAPDSLVRAALAVLYETDLRKQFPALLTANTAKSYDAVVMHPEVANYHNPTAGLNRLSGTMDFFVKTKEILLGVLAFTVLAWNWWRRRLERAAAAADEAQKQQLDGFIKQTLEVELEQMDEADPEKLRPFLRRVTAIKQAALRELTSERVRGDQLFAIFLAQCAALSEKIQMRMMYGKMSGPKA